MGNGMTEARIREIVRDEIAREKAEAAAISSASTAVFRADIRMQLEEFMDSLALPDELREVFEALMTGMIGDQ